MRPPRKILLILLLLPLSVISLHGQQKITLNGYLTDLQSAYYMEEPGWLWENQAQSRLNLDLYPANWLKVTLQARTRFIQGSTCTTFPGYAALTGNDGGWLDLTWSADGSYNGRAGYILTASADRAFTELTFGNFTGTIGRQRINWGQTFVWNPNDIFNAYSYFDVDYPERPGSDAIRLQYYAGMTSDIELAVKADSSGKITAAGYFRFNTHGFDIQLIGGTLSQEDLVVGAGWSGNLKDIMFRGELTYFRNLENFTDTAGYLLMSGGLDYMFGNSLWIQGEVLYSGFAKDTEFNHFMQLLTSDMNVKRLGFTQWSVFTNISYPFSPLLNFSVPTIFYPAWKGLYLGPSMDLSISENLQAAMILQGFTFRLTDPSGNSQRQNIWIGHLRLKWNF